MEDFVIMTIKNFSYVQNCQNCKNMESYIFFWFVCFFLFTCSKLVTNNLIIVDVHLTKKKTKQNKGY